VLNSESDATSTQRSNLSVMTWLSCVHLHLSATSGHSCSTSWEFAPQTFTQRQFP